VRECVEFRSCWGIEEALRSKSKVFVYMRWGKVRVDRVFIASKVELDDRPGGGKSNHVFHCINVEEVESSFMRNIASAGVYSVTMQ
jgi:hypothetical protein